MLVCVTYPFLPFFFFHHAIKEEHQSDACRFKGLHPVPQDIHVFLPLTSTNPVLTSVPMSQTGHPIHNQCGTWKGNPNI